VSTPVTGFTVSGHGPHPETTAIDQVVARYRAEQVAYRTLRDGQAMIVSGTDTLIV